MNEKHSKSIYGLFQFGVGITLFDMNESVEITRQYDSNKKMILQKIGSISRDELIGL